MEQLGMSAGLTSGLDAARFDPAATLVADIGFTQRRPSLIPEAAAGTAS
jgi:hypothetical protein